MRNERAGWQNGPIMGRSGYFSVTENEKKKGTFKGASNLFVVC
jgi:hypothetical protein